MLLFIDASSLFAPSESDPTASALSSSGSDVADSADADAPLSSPEGEELALLREVLPAADSFSAKSGEPLVYRAYRDDPGGGEPELVGYAFMTPDLPPEEVGYSAPIDVLVGMNLEGVLTGLKVVYYRESYRSIRGDFLSTEGFQPQFEDKSIADGFRVGRDVDGVSNATITSWAMSRGVRNASRRVAQAYLQDTGINSVQDWTANAVEQLDQLTWQELIDTGIVSKMAIPQADGTSLELSFSYIGHEGLAEFMVGANDFSRAEREASNRVRDGHLMLVGIGGDSSEPFRQERLGVQQGSEVYPLPRRRFVYAGNGQDGKIAGQVRFAGAMVMDASIDLSRPFTLLYDTGPEMGEFTRLAGVDYALTGVVLDLAEGRPVPSLEEIESEAMMADELARAQMNAFARMIDEAPWDQVLVLLVLFALVMTAFLRKSSGVRWVALACTLVYLGFMDGGFLSISHITNGMKVGPSMYLNDMPLLMIIVFTLVTTLVWGRVFCSSLCPFGALQDFITRLVPRRFQFQVPQAIHDRAIYIKYGILALILVVSLAQTEVSIFQYFEPFGTLFFFSPSALLWVILIAFLLVSSVIKRFYCRYACPLGAALGVVSFVSPLRIKRVTQCDVCKVCEHACPTGAIRGPEIDFKECVRCDVCESKLISRAGVCKHSVEEVRSRLKGWEPVTVIP